jgi:hypothetical protein
MPNRWTLRTNSDTEAGSNVGSNFQLVARDDSGNLIDFPLTVTRGVGGNFTVARPFRVTNTTASTATTNGSGVFNGGLGVAGTINANALALNTALPITSGGTGANTVSQARTNLGIKSTFQYLSIQQSIANTTTNVTSASFVASSLTLTITPKSSSSRFKVFANIAGIFKAGADTWLKAEVRRNGTPIALINGTAGYTATTGGDSPGSCSVMILDTPATASNVTYTIFVANQTGTGTVTIQSNGETSSLVVEEYEV